MFGAPLARISCAGGGAHRHCCRSKSKNGETDMPRKRISWTNVITVASVLVLVGSEVFGAAYAGGWAVGNLLDLADLSYVVVALFCAAGAYAMALLLRACVQVEPFLVGDDDRQPDK
jgi:hypothetical protein